MSLCYGIKKYKNLLDFWTEIREDHLGAFPWTLSGATGLHVENLRRLQENLAIYEKFDIEGPILFVLGPTANLPEKGKVTLESYFDVIRASEQMFTLVLFEQDFSPEQLAREPEGGEN